MSPTTTSPGSRPGRLQQVSNFLDGLLVVMTIFFGYTAYAAWPEGLLDPVPGVYDGGMNWFAQAFVLAAALRILWSTARYHLKGGVRHPGVLGLVGYVVKAVVLLSLLGVSHIRWSFEISALYLLARVVEWVLTDRREAGGVGGVVAPPVPRTRRGGYRGPNICFGARPVGRGYVVGVAGAHVGSNTATGSKDGTRDGNAKDDAWAVGASGEQIIGEMLEQYVAEYGGIVVHGLNFKPGQPDGHDLDHLVIRNDWRIVLVDAKMWGKNHEYDWHPTYDRFGKPTHIVRRDMREWSGSHIGMQGILKYWDEYLDMSAWGLVALAGRPEGYSIDNTGHPGRIMMVDRDHLFEAINACPVRPSRLDTDEMLAAIVSQLQPESYAAAARVEAASR